MLNVLRQKKTMKRILWALAILVIPAFVLWGAGGLRENEQPYKYIGTIEGKKIPFKEFVASLRESNIELFLSYFNQPETLKELQQNRVLLNRLAWNNLIIKHKATKEGMQISDEELITFITNFPVFVRGNQFDQRVYEYFLRNAFGMDMTPRSFEEQVRNCLLISKYKQWVVKDVVVTSEELLDFYKSEFEKVKLNYAVLDKGIFYDSASVSDEQIKEYYDVQKENLRTPERIVLEYIEFPHADEAGKKEAISAIRRAYEILRSDPRKMAPLAKSLNLTIKETHPFARNELIPEMGSMSEIAATAFSLRPAVDIAPIVEEDASGVSYIIRVKEKRPSRVQAKKEAEEFIINMIKDEESYLMAKQEAWKIYNEVIKTKKYSFKEMAEIYGLATGETEFITRFDYITGLGESYDVTEEAFKLRVGEISEPVKVRKGYAFVQPVEFLFIDQKKFEKEKEDYGKKVLAIKRMKAVEEWTKGIQKDVSLEVNLNQL